jgi:hypothetical protein
VKLTRNHALLNSVAREVAGLLLDVAMDDLGGKCVFLKGFFH